jgi:hypothetical protein
VVGVPVHAVPVQRQPDWYWHEVWFVRLMHAVGVPVHAAAVYVQPVCALQYVELLTKLVQGFGVPLQLAGTVSIHEQPGPRTHDADVRCVPQEYVVPEQVPAIGGHMQPGWASQLACVKWFEHAYDVPAHEPGVVAFHAQPVRPSHVSCVNFEAHATDVPMHEPITVVSQLQPGVAGHEVELSIEQVVVAGVPTQRGPVVNVSVGGGVWIRADLQQICALQSLLCLQVFAQVVLHTPWQQISPPIVLQSVDCMHFLGHGCVDVFRQSPPTARFGSSTPTESQHTSLLSVLQSPEPVHALGHFPGGRQMGSL